MNKVTVIGMSCEHCKSAVTGALKDLGLQDVEVDLAGGVCTFAPTDAVSAEQLEEAITDIGFAVGGVQ